MPLQNSARLILFLVAVAASVVTLYIYINDQEMNVYHSYIESLQPIADSYDAAFVGTTSDCHIEEDFVRGPLTNSLIEANTATKPRDLKRLANDANIIKKQIALDAQAAGASISRLSGKTVVGLSRVGFSLDKTTASICVESGYAGDIVRLKKVGFRKWLVTDTRSIWVR